MNEVACEWCGFYGSPLEVHGSVLCQRCRTNINPCCSGETACEPTKEEKDADILD